FPGVPVVTAGIAPGDDAVPLGERAVEVAGELGLEACFLGSTDLTHYGPGYGFTPRGTGPASVVWVRDENDRRIIDRFLGLRPEEVIHEALHHRNACCPGAAAAAVAAGRRAGAEQARLVHYCNSYELAPDSSFVGYAGVVF
ncbi:MAG: AmmeMemoRadiSam system protein B, partial [Spirochaetota bacterium]